MYRNCFRQTYRSCPVQNHSSWWLSWDRSLTYQQLNRVTWIKFSSIWTSCAPAAEKQKMSAFQFHLNDFTRFTILVHAPNSSSVSSNWRGFIFGQNGQFHSIRHFREFSWNISWSFDRSILLTLIVTNSLIWPFDNFQLFVELGQRKDDGKNYGQSNVQFPTCLYLKEYVLITRRWFNLVCDISQTFRPI